MRTLLLSVALVTACGQSRIEASRPATDPSHDALIAAIDTFVAAERTPRAYGELAQTVAALEPTREAELRLIVLAIGPLRALRGHAIGDQIDALALTMWPTLLGADLPPFPGEDPANYVHRLCDGPLADACEHAGALQGATVHAIAIHRASVRAHDAIARCLACSSDPEWHAAALAWEELDREAEHDLANVGAAVVRERPGV